MKQSFLVVFDAEPSRLIVVDTDDIREGLLDSYGFPEWLEKPGVLVVAELSSNLIGAASDLLAALEDIVQRNEIQHWFNLDQARAAIARAKAKGEPDAAS